VPDGVRHTFDQGITMKKSKRALTALAAAGLLLSTLAPAALATGQGSPGTCDAAGYEKPGELDDIDGRTGSASYDWGDLSWSGDSVDVTVKDGFTVEICVKGGSGGDTDGRTYSGSLSGPISTSLQPPPNDGDNIPEISHLGFRVIDEPADPEYFVKFTKTWTGDDIGFGDHDVTFRVNDAIDWNIGDPAAPVSLGDVLTVKETVTTLPKGCEYTTDLDSPVTVPATGDPAGETFIINVTNHVDCDEVEDNVFFNVSFTKTWVGDTELADLDNVEVTFDIRIDDLELTVDDGEIIEVEGSPDDVDVELMDENITGLPDTCDWKFESTSLIDPDNIDVTVTNKVDCAEVDSVVIKKPDTAPETTDKATAKPAAEVKGVSMTAEKKEMPKTGASALLLSLMGMAALGTGGMMIRRRP
jgi:LPXTG-motif cell wall-anchored protein